MPQTHTQTRGASFRKLSLLLLVFLSLSQSVLLVGCHRGFYRRQADNEAKRLITEKANSPRWDSATGSIELDPQSRMFDPFSADHPPIPPDDATSHDLMHTVDQKPGYPHWHANGNTDYVENPAWMSYLPVNEKGEAVLSLSAAYQLALIHSPDLQQQRETLYLSALDVSLQRFGFDSQLFAGFNSFLTTRGRFQGAGGSSTTLESSLGSTGGGITARRLGINGANFVVGLANTILWEFAGNNTQSANSLINFSLIQPLLRGAGRERILESLTQAERTLLANVRQLERFRRGFYLEVATGRNAGAGTARNSNGFLNAPFVAGANAGGYLGLLQQKQRIKNTEFSVEQFASLLTRFRDLFAKDRISLLQVAQFESSVYQQQQNLLNAKIIYQNALDQFKVQIGLPPDLAVVIDDPFLDRFNLIDDRFPERLEEVKNLREEASQPLIALSELLRETKTKIELAEKDGTKFDEDSLKRTLRENTEALAPLLKRAEKVVASIAKEDRPAVAQDIAKLATVLPKRLEYLAGVQQDIESGKLDSEIEPDVFTVKSIPDPDELEFRLSGEGNQNSLAKKLEGLATEVEDRLERIENYDQLEKDGLVSLRETLLNDFVKRLPDLLSEIDGIVLEVALLQVAARANSIEITNVDIDSIQAFETARCMRRDWMNARAALVDQWRQIEFFADQLEAQVDLVLTGEVGTVGDNPFNIRYENGNLRGGFRFDAPIVRQRERNDYRAAQIGYQQARRRYYQFEDTVNQSLRLTLRNIQQDKLLFELNRQNVEISIKQVELAKADLIRPPAVGARQALNPITAQNLSQSIERLLGTQNQYLQLWVEYEVLRRNLDFDLGTMELDETFEWVDPGEIDESIGLRAAAREGIAANDRYCCGMTQPPMNDNYAAYEEETANDFLEGDDAKDDESANGDSIIEAPEDNVEPLEFESSPSETAPSIESRPDSKPIEIERPVPDSSPDTISAAVVPLSPAAEVEYSLPPLGMRKISRQPSVASTEIVSPSVASTEIVSPPVASTEIVSAPVASANTEAGLIISQQKSPVSNVAASNAFQGTAVKVANANAEARGLLNPFRRVSQTNRADRRVLVGASGAAGELQTATLNPWSTDSSPLQRVMLSSGQSSTEPADLRQTPEFRPLPAQSVRIKVRDKQ